MRAFAIFARIVHFDFFAFGSVQKDVHDLRRQLAHRRVQRKPVMRRQSFVIHLGNGAAGFIVPAARLDAALPDRQRGFRQNAFRVHGHINAQTGAPRAGPQGVVEREHAGGEFLHADAVVGAGVVAGEGELVTVYHVHGEQTIREIGGGFHRIG